VTLNSLVNNVGLLNEDPDVVVVVGWARVTILDWVASSGLESLRHWTFNGGSPRMEHFKTVPVKDPLLTAM
jgi:hypothetical protein